MPATEVLHIAAPAKINLGLEVLDRRDDGYHRINTVFAAVGIFDEITLRLRDDDVISCTVTGNDALDSGRTNLCVRAAELIRSELELTGGLDIVLDKRIPVGAGLGGGSSDAAAVLLGARRLWNAGETGAGRLMELGAMLGSDVPFFLCGSPLAAGSSRGEILRPLGLHPEAAVLLVNPGIYVPTPQAYMALGRDAAPRRASDIPALLEAGLYRHDLMRKTLVNDFEETVFAAFPEIGLIKERLYEAGAFFALMSGSGSTVYGLFTGAEQARRAAFGFEEYWHNVCGFGPPPLVTGRRH